MQVGWGSVKKNARDGAVSNYLFNNNVLKNTAGSGSNTRSEPLRQDPDIPSFTFLLFDFYDVQRCAGR